ncbi:uncharacterized protein LOC132707499 [Cylas formicarius]|uniref:uncharacterized protein LOC132707499 n=1 Tax=Cylas formicarius TaxID=197179 RepID=UPI002958C47E|nr:uncharacterized protein LOC132707499 [Cylas formicarius]
MKRFLALVGLIALGECRPEPPVGYNYPIPTPFSSGDSSQSEQSLLRKQPTIQPFQIPSRSYGVPILSSTTAEASSTPSRGYLSDLRSNVQEDYPSFSNSPQAAPGPLVQKHIYFHVAPPFEEEERQAKIQAAANHQKHYKIIFIKAPSYAAPAAPKLQLQAQNEEKTLVYVLVKKPDEAQEIELSTAAPTQPSRPEVYFIRYKAKEDRVQAQQLQQQVEDTDSVVASKGTSGGSSDSSSSGSGARYGAPGQSGPY